MSVTKIQKEIMETLKSPILPGGVKTYHNVCGKPNCQCKHPKTPKLHGPYTQLSYSISGKSSTLGLSVDGASEAQQAVENFKLLKSLVNDLALSYVDEVRADGIVALTQSNIQFSNDGACVKSESAELRNLRKSQEKWKKKALERQEELARDSIKIRDLDSSRDNWKTKAIEAGKTNKELQLRLDKANRQLAKVGGKKKLKTF